MQDPSPAELTELEVQEFSQHLIGDIAEDMGTFNEAKALLAEFLKLNSAIVQQTNATAAQMLIESGASVEALIACNASIIGMIAVFVVSTGLKPALERAMTLTEINISK